MKKVTVFASLGSALEYFDFVIYGMLATYLSKLFFPSIDSSIRLFHIFSTFAIGYLVRPIGGFFFGVLADNIGRKKVLLIVMLIMAFATFFIGVLPTYQQIGALAAVSLTLLRICQGFSFGAELPGAITVVAEFSNTVKRGRNCAFVISSAGIGSIIASFILFLLTKFFTDSDILNWAWRIPFLLGGIFAIIGFFLRRMLEETPYFMHSQRGNTIQILKNHFSSIIFGSGAMLFPACLVIINLYLPAYFSEYFGFSHSKIYLAMTIGLIFCSIVLPISGYFSDIWGKKKIFLISMLLFMLLGNSLLKLCITTNHLVCFMVIYQGFIALALSSYLPMLVELFPTYIRFTGVAICYNIGYFLAAIFPALFSYFMKKNPNLDTLLFFLMAISAISFCCCVWPVLQKKKVYLDS